jgi:hypothetical protein
VHKWLEDVKVGDEVFASYGGGWSRQLTLRKVERVTPTQIVVSGTRYRRKDGRVVGASTWTREWLQEATPELKAEVREEHRRRDVLAKINGVRWGDVHVDTLEHVWDLVGKVGQ